ncbi:ArsR/SmtB family transcription factor [Geotoga petraea]|jgi:ArsR family transcriptional regulator|uniref:Transcriptional regulator, ArsR family n=1 Tax=Geotoga petraea TaxID=28234 RepID=A0A1G6KKN9_9BACT|nr:metalloregulator ArsR/SmtB family transcription factor [Geotoga petraea]SDC31524.1 transcriptional regulator, ArsR family [Geotoga petraea]
MKKDKIEVCKKTVIHEDKLKKIKGEIPKDEVLYELADFFKIFGDTTRIKILNVLFYSELCVCDISESLGMTQSAVSHQLRVLRGANLVKYRKEGKTVFYSLDDEHINQIFNMGMEHILEK